MRVLIADDHEIIRTGLRQILLDEFPAALIDEAGDGKELVQKALSSNWDLVITDIAMPGLSGLEAMYLIRRVNLTLPILIMSIHAKEQYASHVIKLGATAYMSKDTAVAELVNTVKEMLSKRSL